MLNGGVGPHRAVLKNMTKKGRETVHSRRASMSDKNKDELLHVLTCMAWAGNGAFCVMLGGVVKS